MRPAGMSLEGVSRALGGFGAPWCVAGGWALDLFLGFVTRAHGDVDVALFREDQLRLRAHLADWTFEKVEGGALASWRQDEWLRLPVHEVHASRAGARLELLLAEREGEDWVYRRDARVRLPAARLVVRTEAGLPVLTPEVVLLYKAKAPRAVDASDFEAVRGRLSGAQRAWLRQALEVAHPGSAWAERL
jgi:hypothetical protein